jgi:hypothetical protein
MKMAKPWPVLASALNRQLGCGAEWKVFIVREPAVGGAVLEVTIQTPDFSLASLVSLLRCTHYLHLSGLKESEACTICFGLDIYLGP